MELRLKHAEHGFTTVHTLADLEYLRKFGWQEEESQERVSAVEPLTVEDDIPKRRGRPPKVK
jgi:hypothetical protein